MRDRWLRVVEHFLYWGDFVTLFLLIIPGCAERLHSYDLHLAPSSMEQHCGAHQHEYVLRAACRFITYSVLILEFDAARGDMGAGG